MRVVVILLLVTVVGLLLWAASTGAIGKTCQWLRRRVGLDDDALPPGGFEVIVDAQRASPSASTKVPES